MGLTFQEPLLEALPEAVVWVRPDGRVGYLNPRAAHLTGWAVGDAKGHVLSDVLRLEGAGGAVVVDEMLQQCLGTESAGERYAQLRRRDGELVELALSGAIIRDGLGAVQGLVISFRDIGDYLKMARRLTYEANHDGLTGLVNRREALRRLQRMVASAKEQRTEHALCYLDLDRFKQINDLAGHCTGDRVLSDVAEQLHACVRQRDTVARLGGDEFLILLEHCPLLQAIRIGQSIRDAVADYNFWWRGQSLRLGVSIGVVLVHGDGPPAEQLLELADQACYEAKRGGGLNIRVRAGAIEAASAFQPQQHVRSTGASIAG